MNPIGEIENLYPEIKHLNDVLDKSLDLMEKLEAIKAASDLRDRLFEEIESKTGEDSPEGSTFKDKFMAIMMITGLLINKAGTTSEEKILKKHFQSVDRIKGIDDDKEEKARRTEMRRQVVDKPVLLLSYYLVDSYVPIFEKAGFKVLHLNHFPLTPSAREHAMKHFAEPETAAGERADWHDKAVSQYISWIMNGAIDVVIEWQHGREDYPLMEMYQEIHGYVRDLLGNRYEDEVKTMPNFSNPPDFYLCLNWDGHAPEGWQERGYKNLVEIDFDEDDLDVIYQRAMKREKHNKSDE